MNKKVSVKILTVLLSIALILSCLPMAVASENETFSVATLNDIHYYPECLAGDKKEAFYTYLTAANCVYDDLDAMLDAVLESLEYEVKNNGVKHIALVGDLTTNGEYEGHEALAQKMLEFEEKTGANIYVTPGNHDINNPKASTFVNNVKEEARITTPSEFYEIYKDLGFSDAYHQFADFTSEIGGSLSYSVKTDDGYRLILADGGKFTSDVTDSGTAKQETAGKFTAELLEWIIAEAEDAKKDGEIPLLFTHWNMSGANYFHEYLMQGFVIDDGYMLQEILADAGINYTFSGHQHISDISITYSDSGNPMYSVITPTLTQFPFSYRVTDFTENSDGGLDVTFNQRSVDEYSAVRAISGNGTYPSPYRETGFYKQFGGHADATDYVFAILKNTLDKYINGIRAEGSIVKYVEKELDIDIEHIVNSYLFGGISFEGTNLLSGKNVMSFLDDIDRQLMEHYIYNKTETYALIKNALRRLLESQVSEIPCTKFIDDYGFGSTERGGTLGDAVLAIMATMYPGNEDISDDLFLQDIVEFSGRPEFLDFLIGIIKEYIVDDLLVNNILANIELNLDTLFVDETATVGDYVQMIFVMLVSVLDADISLSDISGTVASLVKVFKNFNDVSLKRIIEAVLGTGLIPYGSTIDELIDNLLAQFITEDTKEVATYQAKIIIGGMVTDNTKDHGVTYTNNGAVEVVPTTEDMQLPVNVTLTVTEDNSTSFTVNWFTKYSVTGTDISVYYADGTPAKNYEVTKTTTETEYTAPGFDAGTFGILPWTHKVISHSVTVSGLEPDTEYIYSIGDSEKGFMSEGTVTTAPTEDGSFTFLHLSDTKGFIPSHFEDFSNALTQADKLYPEWSFLAYTGSLTGKASNDDMWTFGINSAEEYFSNKITVYAAGETDNSGEGTAAKYFPVYHAPEQISDTGLYYSYDYGNAHFAVINANLLTSGGALSKEQTSWLKADLEASDKLWNILIMGDTVYGNDADTTLHTQLKGIMEDFDIDLILQGGEAAYIRTDYIRDDAPVLYNTEKITVNGVKYNAYCDAKGTVAVVNAGTSGEYTDALPEGICYEITSTSSLPMFSAITIDGDILTLDTYTVDGESTSKTDSFAIKKAYDVLLGDANLDGNITAADARLALRFSVGLEELSDKQITAANVDLTGDVTAADARLILRASVGLEVLGE